MRLFNLATKTLVFCCALAAISGVAFAQTITDIGPNPPIPGPTDITNFYTPNPGYGGDEKPGGMNYYDDNGNGMISPGQTFLSTTNGVLTSVAYQMGNVNGTYFGGGSGTGPGLMRLRVYQLAGPGSTTATKLAEYPSDPNFTFTASDWLKWTGIAVRVTNGVTYAYTISSGTYQVPGPAFGSQMYCRVYCIASNYYPNGSICLIQAAGGAGSVTYNATANTYDQNFDLGFSDLSVLDKPLALTPSVSPSTTVYGGSPITLTETASGANLHYQWQTDGGFGTMTNIPGATSSNLLQTMLYTGYNPVNYDIIVTNVNGAATSSVVAITVNYPSAPILDTDLSADYPTLSAATYVGGSLTFSTVFEGTMPLSYQWMTNSGSGFHPVPGATNATVTLTNLQLSAAGSIYVLVTNVNGSLPSSTATITILPALPALTPSQLYAYTVYGNNPLVYWRLGETNDTTAGNVPAYDYSGYGHHARYGVNATDNNAGPQSPAYPGFETNNTGVLLAGQVNTPHSYLASPDLNVNTNTVTFTAWINPTANIVTTVGLVFWRNGADAAGFGFGNMESTNGMTELGYTWNNNNSLTWNYDSQLYPPLGQWSFVALTITPTDATFYLYYVDTNTATTNLLKAVNTLPHTVEAFSGGITRVGDDTFDDYRVFPGTIDEVAVFNHALSEAQIKSLFYAALGVPPNVALNITRNSNSQFTLSWPVGTLLEATNLTGPWTVNPAGSPYLVTPSAPRKFYRVQVQ